jgi:Tol biopolymer transport system component
LTVVLALAFVAGCGGGKSEKPPAAESSPAKQAQTQTVDVPSPAKRPSAGSATQRQPSAPGSPAIPDRARGAAARRANAGGIVFTRQLAPELDPELFFIGLNGRVAKRLTAGTLVGPTGPTWSPDGRRLVFAAGRNESKELYVMHSNASRLRRITRNDVADVGPGWSADGRTLVFVRASGGKSRGSAIWVVPSSGGRARRLTSRSIDLQASFSPDGRSIVFLRINPQTNAASVFLMRADGSGQHRILRALGDVSQPSFSPDGRYLLLFDRTNLLVVNANSRGRRILVRLQRGPQGAIQDPSPAWSPDGRFVVFNQLRRDQLDRSDLWIIRADGSGHRRLTTSPGLDSDASWQPPRA